MPSFGRFETVEELASSGPFAVFSARENGQSGPPSFAIKIYRTNDMFADAEVVEREVAAFLEAVDAQKSLPAGAAAGGDGHWAPIHDSGRTDEAVFYVTDLYATTVQRMVDNRRDLDARAVAHVVAGVVDGLAELSEKGGGRGHGSLTPSNVLIGRGEIEEAQVALTDLEAGSRLDKRSNAQDLRDLAGLLFQMVIHRPPPKGGSITTSPEWQRMGGAGDQLRVLCEMLLNPQPGAPLMTFDQIREKLAACLAVKEPKKGGLPLGAKIAIAAVLVGAIGGGAYFAMNATKGPPPDPRPQGWMSVEVKSLEDRVAASTKKAEDNGDELSESKLVAFVEELKTLNAKVAEVRDRPAPLTDADARSIKNAKDETESRLATLTKKFEDLDAAIVVIDPDKDPRDDRWAKTQEAQLAELQKLIEAVAKDMPTEGIPEGGPSVAALRQQVEQVTTRAGDIKAMAWDKPDLSPVDQKAAQAEIHKAVKEAGQQQRLLKATLARSKTEARERLAGFVRGREDASRKGEIVKSAALREAFLRGIRGLDPDRNPDLDWASVKAQSDALTAWLKGLEADFASVLDLQPVPGSTIGLDVALRSVDAKREQLLSKSVDKFNDDGKVPATSDQAYTEARGKLKSEFVGYIAGVKQALGDAVEIERLLSLGYDYAENAGGKTIKALRESVEKSVAFVDVQPSVDGVIKSAAELEQVSTLSDGVRLMNLITSAGSGPGRVSPALAAWSKLQEVGFPAVPADLEGAHRILNERLVPALAQVPDAGRKTALESKARAVLRQMWLVYVHDRANGNPQAVQAAFSSMQKLGVGTVELNALEPWAKHNLERWNLLNKLAEVNEPDPKKQIAQLQKLVNDFSATTAPLGQDNKDAVKSLAAKLKPFAEGKDLDLTREGPGRTGWTATPADEEGRIVTYTWKAPSGRTHTLNFRRVDETADAASYLCTTEMSLGLCIDLIDASGKWDDVKGLTNPVDPDNDPRRGPRVATWINGKMDVSKPTEPDKTGKGWHRAIITDDMVRNSYYPANGAPAEGPDLADPVDFISPGASIYVARLAGCRLPTSSDWKAAIAKYPAKTPNLRDAMFATQHAHIAAIQKAANNNADFPNHSMLRPTPAKLTELKVTLKATEQDNEPAVQGSDGWLYFAPVAEGSQDEVYHHLLGNVWEYVYEDAAVLNQFLAQSVGTPTPPPAVAAINEMLKAREKVRVIGGSAISPKELPTGEPLDFNWGQSRVGFADAGFRLAFSTGAGTGGTGKPAERLAKILSGDYLARSTK